MVSRLKNGVLANGTLLDVGTANTISFLSIEVSQLICSKHRDATKLMVAVPICDIPHEKPYDYGRDTFPIIQGGYFSLSLND